MLKNEDETLEQKMQHILDESKRLGRTQLTKQPSWLRVIWNSFHSPLPGFRGTIITTLKIVLPIPFFVAGLIALIWIAPFINLVLTLVGVALVLGLLIWGVARETRAKRDGQLP